MPTRVSSIETHPQRVEIIAALSAEQPYRTIEKWTEPRVTTATLSRFKRQSLKRLVSSVTQAQNAITNSVAEKPQSVVKSVTQAALAVAIDPFVQTALRSAARRERWMDDLEVQPDIDAYRVLATMDRNDLAAQEYHAKLAGRLDSGTNIQIQVVVPAAPGAAPPDDWDGVTIDLKPGK